MKSIYSEITFKSCLTESEAEGFPVSERTEPALTIYNIVTSLEGHLMIRTAIKMAPGVPTAVAFEEVFEKLIGDAAFTNDMKQYTGFLIRRVVERMGGNHVEKGVSIKRASRYTRGSIYSL